MSKQPLMKKGDIEGGKNEFDANLTSTGLNKEDEIAKAKMTDLAQGLSHEEAARRLKQYGENMLQEDNRNECLVFLGNFWGPMPIMIWIAILVEAIQADWTDFAVLLGLQMLNGCVSYVEEKNAGDAIAALKANLAPKSVVRRGGSESRIDARYLVPGDVILVKLGDIVPADAEVMGNPSKDQLEVDQAALTGESLPVTIFAGEMIKMGSTIKRGDLDAVVCFTGPNTFFGNAAALVASVNQVGRFQKVLFSITMFLLTMSLFLVAIIMVVLLLAKVSFLKTIGICVVLLVASIPIAMQVVSTSTMAVGSRRLAEKKVIVAKLSAIEELAGMDMLCSDKTGTLTQNKLQLFDPILETQDFTDLFPGLTDPVDGLNFISALAAKRVSEGQDAIDFCIVNSVTEKNRFSEYEEIEFLPFDPENKRTEATVKHKKTGQIMRVTKGAPQRILRMAHNKHEIYDKVEQAVQDLADRGYRSLGVGHSLSGEGDDDWVFDGVLSLFDPPRHDTADTIAKAKENGIQVKMITGDHGAIAKETARTLNMGTNILNTGILNSNPPNLLEIIRDAHGFAEVLPEHKFMIVKKLQEQGFTVGMTGDGVNDAPALKCAQIGIAVEGSTDAARAAADIVLTEPGLGVIIEAILRARKIFQRVRNYGIYRVACTIQLVFFFFIAICLIHPSSYYCATSDGSPVKVDEGMGVQCVNSFSVTQSDTGKVEYNPTALAALTQTSYFGKFLTLPPKPNSTAVSQAPLCARMDANGKDFIYTPWSSPLFKDTKAYQCLSNSASCDNTTLRSLQSGAPDFTTNFDRYCPNMYPAAQYRFTLPVLAIVIITILNDVSIITIARDKVIPATSPQGWDLPQMSVIASIIGLVATISSLILLIAGLNAADGFDNTYSKLFGESATVFTVEKHFLQYDTLIMLLYLKISVSDFLTVFAARTKWFFWERRPGYALFAAFILATTVSSSIAGAGTIPDKTFRMLPISGKAVGLVWAYNLVFFLFQDVVKISAYWVFDILATVDENTNFRRRMLEEKMSAKLETERKGVRASGILGPNAHKSGSAKSAAAGAGGGGGDLEKRVDKLEKSISKIFTIEEEVNKLKAKLN